MGIAEIMTRDPECAVPGDPIAKAASRMRHLNCGALPVVTDAASRRLVGILTDRDIAVRCTAEGHDPGRCRVADHMTPDPLDLPPGASVDELVDLMSRAQVRRVPVTEGPDRRVVGIVAVADLVTRANRPDVALKVVARVSEPAPVALGE